MEKDFLSVLPAETVVHLFSFLDFRTLLNCALTCRRLHDLSKDEDLWRLQCRYFLLFEKFFEEQSWNETFKRFFKEYGRYLSCYKDIKKAWNQIEQFFSERSPPECLFLKSLNGPASENVLDTAERKMGQPLPLDLRCSLRIHNGQGTFSRSGGLLNSSKLGPPPPESEYLLDVMTMTEKYEGEGESQGCAPITYRSFSRFNGCQVIALTEEGGHTLGEVFVRVLRLKGYKQEDQFITGCSYTQWLTRMAEDISENRYLWEEDKLCRFLIEPSCVAVTDHFFTTTVATCFLSDISSVIPAHFTFKYHITISMDESAPEGLSCQLETRHWIITDEDDNEERVDGAGVVGQFPVFHPGDSHSWVSYTYFATTYGNMRGHFTMRNLKTGKLFNIECPCFHMKCLPYKLSEERGIKRRQRKKRL